MAKIRTRFGDGTPVELSESELMQDLETGTAEAAERGNIPVLSEEELQHLFDIFKAPYNFISVEPGNEVILSYDAGTLKIRRVGVNVDRIVRGPVEELTEGFKPEFEFPVHAIRNHNGNRRHKEKQQPIG